VPRRWYGAPPMAAKTADVVAYLDDLLQIDRFADYGPNGLQVPGG
jgi:putative NIF3 family GTP cyclohydrolase 1 type 2